MVQTVAKRAPMAPLSTFSRCVTSWPDKLWVIRLRILCRPLASWVGLVGALVR